MLPYRDSPITKAALAIFFLIIVGSAYFEVRGILWGPSIAVPQSIKQVSNPYIEITGTTTHISSLEMNGASVPVTETGSFDVPYVLTPGDNRIVLDAKDTYGHTTQKVLQIVYTPSSTSSETAATSTGTTTASSTSTPSSASSEASTTPVAH